MALQASLNTFAGNPLNRVSDRRTDAAWLAEKLDDPQSLAVAPAAMAAASPGPTATLRISAAAPAATEAPGPAPSAPASASGESGLEMVAGGGPLAFTRVRPSLASSMRV